MGARDLELGAPIFIYIFHAHVHVDFSFFFSLFLFRSFFLSYGYVIQGKEFRLTRPISIIDMGRARPISIIDMGLPDSCQ